MTHCGWPLLGPLHWIRFINARVRVKAGKYGEHEGRLVSVDPLSASVVLLDSGQWGASVRVLMGHVVEEVQVLQEADQETSDRLWTSFLSPRTPDLNLDQEGLRRRRECLHRWLAQNRIPVEEDGDQLRVAGVLTVSAPYRLADCSGSNPTVLDRVQRLIQIQPENDPDQSERNSRGSAPSCLTSSEQK